MFSFDSYLGIKRNFFIIFLCILFTSCGSSTQEPLTRTDFVLGTPVTISLYDGQSEPLLEQCFEQLRGLENLLSINKTGTVVDKINHLAGIAPVTVEPQAFELIKTALEYSHLTQGAFDITIGPLVKLWHIGFPDATVPSIDEINQRLPLINYKNVVLDDNNHTIFLQKTGMMLDLGGIAKGYAADQLVTLLKAHGVKHAIINLGGNVYALGDKPDHSLWTIGIQDPFHPLGETIGTITAKNQSLVTSGIYERYITDKEGHNYHHILNPHTGYPYDNNIASVTVVSDHSTDGDALSTSLFALGISEGLKFVETLPNIEAIFITQDAKVFTSSGLKSQFTLTSSDFTLQH